MNFSNKSRLNPNHRTLLMECPICNHNILACLNKVFKTAHRMKNSVKTMTFLPKNWQLRLQTNRYHAKTMSEQNRFKTSHLVLRIWWKPICAQLKSTKLYPTLIPFLNCRMILLRTSFSGTTQTEIGKRKSKVMRFPKVGATMSRGKTWSKRTNHSTFLSSRMISHRKFALAQS